MRASLPSLTAARKSGGFSDKCYGTRAEPSAPARQESRARPPARLMPRHAGPALAAPGASWCVAGASKLIGIAQACTLVRRHALRFAPRLEKRRAYQDSRHAKARGLQLLLDSFGMLQPSIESIGQVVRIAEQPQECGVVASMIPRQRNRNWPGHGLTRKFQSQRPRVRARSAPRKPTTMPTPRPPNSPAPSLFAAKTRIYDRTAAKKLLHLKGGTPFDGRPRAARQDPEHCERLVGPRRTPSASPS